MVFGQPPCTPGSPKTAGEGIRRCSHSPPHSQPLCLRGVSPPDSLGAGTLSASPLAVHLKSNHMDQPGCTSRISLAHRSLQQDCPLLLSPAQVPEASLPVPVSPLATASPKDRPSLHPSLVGAPALRDALLSQGRPGDVSRIPGSPPSAPPVRGDGPDGRLFCLPALRKNCGIGWVATGSNITSHL